MEGLALHAGNQVWCKLKAVAMFGSCMNALILDYCLFNQSILHSFTPFLFGCAVFAGLVGCHNEDTFELFFEAKQISWLRMWMCSQNTRVKGNYYNEVIRCIPCGSGHFWNDCVLHKSIVKPMRIKKITQHRHCRLATQDACREVSISPTESNFSMSSCGEQY